MSLHDRIMALPIDKEAHQVERIGFRVSRKEAAIIAKEADYLMSGMADALKFYAELDEDFGFSVATRQLKEYNDWKENNK